MSFCPYPKYKSSGCDELGAVPVDWQIMPLKHIAGIDSCGCYGVEPEAAEHVSPVATTAQISPEGFFLVDMMPQRGFSRAELSRFGCAAGDILVVKSSGSATNIISGKAGLVGEDTPPFVFSNFLMRVRPKKELVEPKWIYYVLRSHLTRQRVEKMCSTTTYPNLSVSEYCGCLLPMPQLPEQRQVVSFLDQETFKIDALISEQQRLIELLKEKRQAIISHAVTKGLNPDVRMKPSGVEWLGEVPEHWEVLRFKKLISVLTDYTANGSFASLAENVTYRSEGFSRLVRLTDLRENLLNEGLYVDESAHQFLKKSELFGGEVLLANVGAYAGFACMMPQAYGPSTLGPNMYLIHFRDEILSNSYGLECLMSLPVQEQLKVMATSTAQPKLNKDNVRAVVTAIPPSKTEQEEILNYISEQKKKIDALINESHRSIDLLTERRTALISAAVTGKIDVRNYAATQKDAA